MRGDRPAYALDRSRARGIWLRAQRLDSDAPFGKGPGATLAAIEHLGYVQIDTIHVIERCHHHILYTRIPEYRRSDLHHVQSVDKTVFEYWTHALSYVPVRDLPFFVRAMKRHSEERSARFSSVTDADLRKVLRLLARGPLTIRDIDDDVLVEKTHPWASRKPSKRALQLAFYRGIVTVSQRSGMLKTYDLAARHFGWSRLPKGATVREGVVYQFDRALRAQGIVSLDSAAYLAGGVKAAMRQLIEQRVRRGELVPVEVEGAEPLLHWARPETLEERLPPLEDRVHILSPFDPLVNQRKRMQLFFGYEHRFEAYVPKDKRVYGYFALPVLVGDEFVALLDLKTDREARKLLLQRWTWLAARGRRALKQQIEAALHRFESFQLAAEPGRMLDANDAPGQGALLA
jgi:uncharacterized protein